MILAVGATKTGTLIVWDRQPVRRDKEAGSGKLNPEYALYTPNRSMLGSIVTAEVEPYKIVNEESVTQTNKASVVVIGDSTSSDWSRKCKKAFKDQKNKDGSPRYTLAYTGKTISVVTDID